MRLHYVSQGTGPLIVVVHGFPEFWYAWRNQLAEFGRDYRAVAVDMRGYNLYITTFRTPQAEQILSADNYARLAGVLGELFKSGQLTSADSVEYIKAWSQPGALTGALNYYRAMPMGPPAAGAPIPNMNVMVPTLVIWGERDPYLLTGNLDGLEAYVPRLTVKRIPDATHWVVHERPAQVNSLIRDFVR